MAIAETARLIASLELQDKLSGPALKAAATVSTLDRGVSSLARRGISGLQRGFGLASTAAGRFGAALGNAKNRIIGLLTGPLGMLGLGAGLFSLGGLFKSGIDKAREFGGVVSRLTQLTGLSVATTSRLAAAFDHFGIAADSVKTIVGLAEKNLGLLTSTQAKGAASTEAITKARERLHVAEVRLNEVEHQRHVRASTLLAAQNRVADSTRALNALLGNHGKAVNGASAFYKKYGLSLVDASGHAKNFNTLLLDSADFFNNKSIPAQTKAAALSKIYGRGWQELIPILSAGRKGISDAEDEATKLGVTLTKDNLVALAKAKEATRTWGDALGGLKLQIGLAVLPALTDFTKAVTGIVVTNRTKIVAFIKSIADGAGTLAGAFNTHVLPALRDIASVIGTAFNAGGGLSFTTILHESANFAKDLGSAINSFVVPAIKAIVGAWDGLPDDLRGLLIKGFIANKVVKWTFGFDAVGFGVKMAESFLANVAGKLTADVGGALVAAGIGKAFVQPVFVTNPGFGLPGGGGGPAVVPTTGGGVVGAIKTGLQIVLPIAAAVLIANAIREAAGIPANTPTRGQFGPRTAGQSVTPKSINIPTITKRDADGIRSGLVDVTAQTKKVWASQEENRRAIAEASKQTVTANDSIRRAVIAEAQQSTRDADGIRSAVRDKDLSVTIPITQTTYINGRLFDASVQRYNSTTPPRRP